MRDEYTNYFATPAPNATIFAVLNEYFPCPSRDSNDHTRQTIQVTEASLLKCSLKITRGFVDLFMVPMVAADTNNCNE